MSRSGDLDSITIAARSALLDALEALGAHRDEVIVVGAQAVYLRTKRASVAIAEFTKDSDLVLDPRQLAEEPLLENAMHTAGFLPAASNQPGAWVNPNGIPVDLMVPDALQGSTGRHRSARIPPHSDRATRRTVGLEACVVQHTKMTITALDPADKRSAEAHVASTAALIVAKIHKIHERVDSRRVLSNKDAYDVYRLLVAETNTAALANSFRELLAHPVSESITNQAVNWLGELFESETAIGSQMAGQTEAGLGDPEQVAISAHLMVDDLLKAVSNL